MCRVGGVIQKTFRRFFGDVLFVGKFWNFGFNGWGR